MKASIAFTLILLLTWNHSSQPKSFDEFSGDFAAGYKALHIPGLELSYVSWFKHFETEDAIEKEIAFFSGIEKELQGFQSSQLSHDEQQDFTQIKYETSLNLERLALEKQWLAIKPAEVPTTGIYTVANGKGWYKFLLKRWISADVTPGEIYNFGMAEVKRVQGHIEAIRAETGLGEDAFYAHLNQPDFFISDPQIIQKSFEQTRDIIYSNLGKVFNEHAIPTLSIKKGIDETLAQTPGYYSHDTFYYNLFNKPYNKRQVDWLFIHEAVPGHHYQSSVYAQQSHSKVQQLFFYIGLAEGWAAYTEELGKDLGVYKTPYAELGKWEWDIVRSVRVPMDVGLNYFGWTDEQALAFWKKNIRNQDDIAMREIARVKRWPAQAITYKYGAVQMMQWKQQLQKTEGLKFNIKDFHDRILNHGSLPLFMVKANVLR